MVPIILQAVLSHYPAASTLQRCESVAEGGFSGAAVWRVETLAGTLALRRWPPEAPPPDRLRGLHALLQHLRQSRLTLVAVPLPNRSGSTLTHLQDSWWQLEPWLPGTADYNEHPSPARLTATMQALARWHVAAQTFVPAPSARPWFAGPASGPAPAVVERIPKTEEMLNRLATTTVPGHLPTGEWRDVCERLQTGCRQHGPGLLAELKQASQVAVPLQICLRDVWHDHILSTGDTVTGLIDPSASRWDTVATDLARLLGSLVGDDAEQWESALAAYHRERPLTPEERRLIPLLDRSGVVLSGETWIERLSQPTGKALTPRLLQRLRAIAERMEHLRPRLVL